jgi:hypothetical protein
MNTKYIEVCKLLNEASKAQITAAALGAGAIAVPGAAYLGTAIPAYTASAARRIFGKKEVKPKAEPVNEPKADSKIRKDDDRNTERKYGRKGIKFAKKTASFVGMPRELRIPAAAAGAGIGYGIGKIKHKKELKKQELNRRPS